MVRAGILDVCRVALGDWPYFLTCYGLCSTETFIERGRAVRRLWLLVEIVMYGEHSRELYPGVFRFLACILHRQSPIRNSIHRRTSEHNLLIQ